MIIAKVNLCSLCVNIVAVMNRHNIITILILLSTFTRYCMYICISHKIN